jgi:hypothetical protein
MIIDVAIAILTIITVLGLFIVGVVAVIYAIFYILLWFFFWALQKMTIGTGSMGDMQ